MLNTTLVLRSFLGASLAFTLLNLSGCQDKTPDAASLLVNDSAAPFQVTVLADNLDQPWSLAFLPNTASKANATGKTIAGMLITQKSGQLVWITSKQRSAVAGLPDIPTHGQGGLMDVALHPNFAKSSKQRWVYLTYIEEDEGVFGTALGRGRWQINPDGRAELVDWQPLFSLPFKTSKGQHFGSRIAFDLDGHVYFSIGERGSRDRAQALDDPAGSIIRLNLDGSVPKDNPFLEDSRDNPTIFSYGHRNPQGLARHPVTGEIWELEPMSRNPTPGP